MNVRFGICADLHLEFIHDSVSRLEKFLNACKNVSCDFCIELGDFCPPGETNSNDKKYILDLMKNAPFPFYHVLGNHDLDHNQKSDVMIFLGSKAPYYSYDCGGVHFVVLDACYFRDGDKYCSYNRGNYKCTKDAANISVLPPEMLSWLETDLSDTKYPSVLFSHQSLIESRSGIGNADALRRILEQAPQNVILSACGHEHVDRLEKENGTYYWCVNSMSYYWAGSSYAHTTYGEETEKQHPMLRCVFPYRDPLFAIVDINDNNIQITGNSSNIVGETPAQLQFSKPGLADPITASIQSRKLLLQP